MLSYHSFKKGTVFTGNSTHDDCPHRSWIRICMHACKSDVSATAVVETDTAEVTAPAGLAAVTKPGPI